MKIIKSVFEKSSSKISECPKGNLPEFALVGRSNVGKSSLINTFLSYWEDLPVTFVTSAWNNKGVDEILEFVNQSIKKYTI